MMKNRLKRYIRKGIALLGILALLVCAIPVQAAEGIVKPSDIEEQLNYAYVESPYLETPGTQRIVVSWGDEESDSVKMVLQVQKNDGMQEEWSAVRTAGNLFLFEKEFTDPSQSGTYEVTEIQIQSDQQQVVISVSDLEADIQFGVNEMYDGSEELQPLGGTSEEEAGEPADVAIMTIGEDGSVQEQKSIGAALNAAENDRKAAVPRMIAAENDAESGVSGPEDIVIALDPGHDSTHSGAQSSNGALKEHILTLKIANYCKEELEKYDHVTVYMTRTEEACPYPGTGASGDDIAKRVNAAAAKGARIFVSFHLNSSTASGPNGAEVIIPNKYNNAAVAEEGKKLAERIMDELTALGLHRRDIYSKSNNGNINDDSTRDYFAVQNASKAKRIPGIIIEHAFLTNSGDISKFLGSENGLRNLGVADATGIAKYLNLTLVNHWVMNEDGKWRWEEGETYKKNEWFWWNGTWYWLDAGGYRTTGWVLVNKKWYYMNSNGAMQTGWVYVAGKWYYMDSSGAMLTGWQYINKKWYYLNGSGAMETGVITVGGKRYCMDSSGAMLTGWAYVNGKWYYLNSSGVAQTGWLKLGKTWYYLSNSGEMLTGWAYINGKWYYLDSSGAMLTGWAYVNGKWYYLDGSGAMLTGWVYVEGRWYYLSGSGAMLIGWAYVNGKWYYLDGSGAMLTGWAYVDGRWYYLNSSGAMQTGWAYVNGKWYYLNGSGAMLTGWAYVDGRWYYLNGSGAMLTGWVYVDKKWYYLNSSGAMLIGKQIIDGKSYYFNDSGEWIESSGNSVRS